MLPDSATALHSVSDVRLLASLLVRTNAVGSTSNASIIEVKALT